MAQLLKLEGAVRSIFGDIVGNPAKFDSMIVVIEERGKSAWHKMSLRMQGIELLNFVYNAKIPKKTKYPTSYYEALAAVTNQLGFHVAASAENLYQRLPKLVAVTAKGLYEVTVRAQATAPKEIRKVINLEGYLHQKNAN